MKVWLVRTADYDSKTLEKVEELLNAYDGPLSFMCHAAIIDDSIITKGYIFPDKAMNAISKFRKAQKIDSSDFVCLYTNTSFSNNFFTHGDGHRNFIIHSGDWGIYTNAGNIFPDSYLLYSNILKSFIYKNYETMYENLHKDDSLGCYMDLCADKREILLKLRTGDICDKCLDDIQKEHLDGRLLGQILDAFEGLRKQLLFRNRLEIETRLSRMEIIKGKFILIDYGNIELKFSPVRKAIYKLFLESENGYTFAEILGQKKRLLELYKSFQPNKTIEELSSTLNRICDPHAMRIHEEISKINAEVVKKLGERVSVNYIISGERGEKRKVKFKNNSLGDI